MTMKQKNKILILSLPAITSCHIQDPSEYGRDLLNILSDGTLKTVINSVISRSVFPFQTAAAAGLLLFLFSLVFLFFNRKNSSILFMGITGLTGTGLYAVPFLNLIESLPRKETLILQILTLFLITFYIMLRLWSIRTFHHRKKPWIRNTRVAVYSLTYLFTLLAWFNPVLISRLWPVTLMAVFTFTDSTLCSFLSLKRKDDRSGFGGLFFSAAFLGGSIWSLLASDKHFILFRSLNDSFFFLPAFLMVFIVLLTGIMMQTELGKQRMYLRDYKKHSENLEKTLETEEKQYQRLQQEMTDSMRIPGFHLHSARMALQIDPIRPLKMPKGWEGSHFLEDNSSFLPGVAAWPYQHDGNSATNTLLMVESTREDRYAYLSMEQIRNRMNELIRKGTTPSRLFPDLNKTMSDLGEIPEHPLSSALLYFMESSFLCATAGGVMVWFKKPGQKMVPISSREVPATFHQGLGFRPYSRETGQAFRLQAEKGDTIIILSRSLLMREQSLNGQIYGKESLIRVLNNHEDADADTILSALIKDFDDFDMGNTADRQVYACVIRKA